MIEPTTARDLIKPHMPVVCSDDKEFATVDHLERGDSIKLTRDESGQHHYIPLSWVTSVDDKVHIDRPGDQAMEEWSATPPTESLGDEVQEPAGTTTDKTRGKPLVARVDARKAELERALAGLGPRDGVLRTEIELALATANSLTTGDMTRPSDVVSSQLNNWLERNKYLAMTAEPTERIEAVEIVDDDDEDSEEESAKNGHAKRNGHSL